MRSAALMQTLDAVNRRFGRDALRAGVAGELVDAPGETIAGLYHAV